MVAVGLTGGGSAALDVSRASAPALRGATLSAPPASPRRRAQLAAAVDGVAFPYWEDRLGSPATGARAVRIDGRAVTTVFYANGARQQIGYEIFAGKPAPGVGSGVVTGGAARPTGCSQSTASKSLPGCATGICASWRVAA
jgi:hypothetical protein